MTAKLTPELQKALRESGRQSVELLEPQTGTIYVLIAKERVVTREDVASIQRGIEHMQGGQGRPVRESRADLGKQLGVMLARGRTRFSSFS